MKIYTKKGDKGSTSILGGTELSKNDPVIETLGTVDELNSTIGILYSSLKDKSARDMLRWIQEKLYVSNSNIAFSMRSTKKDVTIPDIQRLIEADVKRLEVEIDLMDEKLPELSHFISPGGTMSSAYAHMCRSVCRRAERRMVTVHSKYPLPENLLKFFNRLSDYFFTLGRTLDTKK
ncbi:MAG: cob(I)yrinic acid a,c-diamide adenosyltransferase [Acidobacteria bacterium]|nr:cob(I)yrinic acid a,c-diamide adenosyltransferase [Acidobacteriota bacterium]